MNNINLNWLKVFMVVATSNSFLDASKKLYISQPAISKSIKLLEEELHINLFYRGNRGICLTPKGEQLLQYILEANDLLETAQRMITKDDDMQLGELIIGAQSHIVRYYLLEKIEKFRKDYPNIKIRIVDLSTSDLLDALEKHKIDFIIDSSPIETIYNNTLIKPIAYLDTCFIKNAKNKMNITNKRLFSEQDIILPLARSSLRKTLEQDLSNYNISLNPKLEFETEELIIESVKRDLGVGFVVKNAVSNDVEEGHIKVIDIDYDLPKVEINLVYVYNYLSELSKKFINNYILEDDKI